MAKEFKHMELPLEIKRNISDLNLGRKRKSMKKNAILQKPKIGQRLNICKDLPDYPFFIYGKPNVARDGGVPEVFRWASFKPTPDTRKQPKDFVKLNARAAICGFGNAIENNYFRAANDYRVKPPSTKPTIHKPLPGVKLPPDHTFGCKTRVCSPIDEVLGGRFGTSFLAAKMKHNEEVKERKKAQQRFYENPRMNRSARLAVRQPHVEELPLWKMSKWHKVPAHLNTFRSQSLRERAFVLHQSDAVGRHGVFGHGVYEGAKTLR